MLTNRTEAGRLLVPLVVAKHLSDPIVLALPRGGVPVAEPIAHALHAPLDVLIVRKLGAPWNREFAWGALGENGILVQHEALGSMNPEERAEIIRLEEAEIARRVLTYRQGRALPSLAGRDVVIVDDGLATGATATAGVRVAQALGAAYTLLVVPVGAPEAVAELSQIADDVVCLSQPVPFSSVGEHYREFPQVSDQEVVDILRRFSPTGET